MLIAFPWFFKWEVIWKRHVKTEPENRETATNHSGKGACVYATYRDRSVCAVACYSRCITGSSCFLFYPNDFASCICRVLNIDEGTEISDRVDMHHASYQSVLSLTHHLEISSSTRRHGDFIRQRSYTPYSAINLTRLRSAASGDTRQRVGTNLVGKLKCIWHENFFTVFRYLDI